MVLRDSVVFATFASLKQAAVNRNKIENTPYRHIPKLVSSYRSSCDMPTGFHKLWRASLRSKGTMSRYQLWHNESEKGMSGYLCGLFVLVILRRRVQRRWCRVAIHGIEQVSEERTTH